MLRFLRPLAPLAALLTASCSLSARPPKSPAQGGSPWIELTTKHFVVLTDVSDADARAAATDYETAFEELRAAAFPRTDGARFTVVLFQDERERIAFRPPTTGAEFADRLNGDLERAPTIILNAVPYAMFKSDARETFLHELTHSFVARTYGGVPVWLNEGLAQYLSTMRVEGGNVTLGEIPSGYRLTRGFTVSVGELLAVDRFTFYGEEKQTFAGNDARYRYYTGSWAFVHFLQNGPAPIRAQFRAFIEKLDAREELRDAWRETLGRVPKADIEASFATYVTSDAWAGVERPFHPAPPSPVEHARPLGDEEVHLLWARLTDPSLPAKDPRSEEAQIAEAARVAPDSAELSYQRGCRALTQGRRDEAAAQFEAALAVSPAEPRYLLAAIEAHSGSRADESRMAQAKLRSWLTQLTVAARSADELGLLARIEAAEGNGADALHHADAALAADPGYYGAHASRAFVHFRAGRYAEAVADQERAIALAPEGAHVEAFRHTLEVYRQAH